MSQEISNISSSIICWECRLPIWLKVQKFLWFWQFSPSIWLFPLISFGPSLARCRCLQLESILSFARHQNRLNLRPLVLWLFGLIAHVLFVYIHYMMNVNMYINTFLLNIFSQSSSLKSVIKTTFWIKIWTLVLILSKSHIFVFLLFCIWVKSR